MNVSLPCEKLSLGVLNTRQKEQPLMVAGGVGPLALGVGGALTLSLVTSVSRGSWTGWF